MSHNAKTASNAPIKAAAIPAAPHPKQPHAVPGKRDSEHGGHPPSKKDGATAHPVQKPAGAGHNQPKR